MLVMSSLMHRALQIAGVEWAHAQEKKASLGQPRSYRMLEAAFSHDLQEFFGGMMRTLLQLPRGLGLEQMTLKLKQLHFRVASRSMCSMHMLLRGPRRMHPYVLFRALATGTYEDMPPPCMHDALASFFLSKFPNFTADAKACLEGLAEAVDRCISSIESRHALSRRLTVARGVQTWTPKLASTSAEFSLRQVLLQENTGLAAAAQENPASAATATAAKPAKKAPGKQRGALGGGGGPYRAFLHERCAGQKLNRASMKALADEYRNLGEDAMTYFREQGRLATLAWRNGYHAFGERRQRTPGLEGHEPAAGDAERLASQRPIRANVAARPVRITRYILLYFPPRRHSLALEAIEAQVFSL